MKVIFGTLFLILFTTQWLLAQEPYKNGHGTPVFEEIPTLPEGIDYGLKPIVIAKDEIAYWTCPMHPQVKMGKPGKCPICGEDLIPVMTKPDSETQTSSTQGRETPAPQKK